MLAPEEVFAGKGEIKEAAELTQSDRKRRRANKKRKYKGKVIIKIDRLSNPLSIDLPTSNKGIIPMFSNSLLLTAMVAKRDAKKAKNTAVPNANEGTFVYLFNDFVRGTIATSSLTNFKFLGQ